jgi:hypothetical protein
MSANTNPVDTMRGQSLKLRVAAHKETLENSLAKLGPGDRSRREIEQVLSEVDGLLTGDLDHIPKVVAAELSRWLEASKYIGVKTD